MKFSKNANNKICAPWLTFFNEKKIQKDSNDFWHRKLTLKVKFRYFLTAPHYSNFQNLEISFEYSWFLAKNLSNFVSLPWKLHNRECHTAETLPVSIRGILFSNQTIYNTICWFAGSMGQMTCQPNIFFFIIDCKILCTNCFIFFL